MVFSTNYSNENNGNGELRRKYLKEFEFFVKQILSDYWKKITNIVIAIVSDLLWPEVFFANIKNSIVCKIINPGECALTQAINGFNFATNIIKL